MDRGKRAALLAAARTAVLESGAAGFKLEMVLGAAGAGTGTLYHHFPGGKEELLREVYEETRVAYEEGLLRVLHRNRDPEAAVKALVHHHVRWFASERQLAQILLWHRGAEQPGSGRTMQRALRAWAASAGLPERSPDKLAALWLGPVLEWGRLWLGGAAGDVDAAADRLAKAAWNAVSSV